jgi:hypothetical protein
MILRIFELSALESYLARVTGTQWCVSRIASSDAPRRGETSAATEISHVTSSGSCVEGGQDE